MSEQDFNQALELYRTNLLQYRLTGKSEYKIAYENAERWINLHLEEINRQITSGKTFVNRFLQDYSTANPDLVTLKTRFRQIRSEGPRTQDEYAAIRRINEQNEAPADMTSQYVKAGVLIALVGAVIVLNTF